MLDKPSLNRRRSLTSPKHQAKAVVHNGSQ